MAIKTGDKAYFLKDTLDFRLYQIEVIIAKIDSVPTLGKSRAKLYCGVSSHGTRESSYWYGQGWLKRKRLIRKTPFPDVPLLKSEQEIMEFTTRKEKP